jgi:hypothetical protein
MSSIKRQPGRDSSVCMIKILPRIQSVYNNNFVSAFFEKNMELYSRVFLHLDATVYGDYV